MPNINTCSPWWSCTCGACRPPRGRAPADEPPQATELRAQFRADRVRGYNARPEAKEWRRAVKARAAKKDHGE